MLESTLHSASCNLCEVWRGVTRGTSLLRHTVRYQTIFGHATDMLARQPPYRTLPCSKNLLAVLICVP